MPALVLIIDDLRSAPLKSLAGIAGLIAALVLINVAGLIGLILLAAIGGFIGWRVWRRSQRAPAL
ncbi:MAG: hypothetical protein JKP95_00840 [Oceanicaulis sp.]|nr:hypothetical protein [Oceanicaulis sp.]